MPGLLTACCFSVGCCSDDNTCAECDNREENWLCLSCHSVHCGRFASSHARKHAAATGHLIACGLADLSFWCYRCDSYLHHLSMQPVYLAYRTLHQLKFGEETVDVLEFTQPGVFSIQEGREEDELGGETAVGSGERNEQEPLSLSAGMGGTGSEVRKIGSRDKQEGKSEIAAKNKDVDADVTRP